MTDELRESVKSRILQYLENNLDETNKFEVKRKWYNLREDNSKFEFLKDITAIVNSYGGEDAFIVFGIDENTRETFSTKISDSGYKDPAYIKNVINANITAPILIDIESMEINDQLLCILHLPPSTDKPHCILKYKRNNQVFENEIFIRSGSAKVVASKSDIDRMYIERKNIIVERKLELSINLSNFRIQNSENRGLYIDHPITIENTGMRDVAIARIEIELLFGIKENNDFQNVHFFTKKFSFSNLIIESGKLFNGKVYLISLFNDYDYYRSVMLSYVDVNTRIRDCRVTLSNGDKIYPRLFVQSMEGDFPVDPYSLLF